MLLCSKFQNVIRVRPSQGDHGIDVFVPGPRGFGAQRSVYQVKKYASNLTSTQKRRIKQSYQTVVQASEREGWEITDWHLVMPLDLTTQNLGWLDEVLENAPFPCEPHGLVYCDTLAAHHPKVIDYYFRDGRQRLEDATDNLVQVLAGRQDRERNRGLVPADVFGDLLAIYSALNTCDPFFRYEYSVGDSPPSDTAPPDEDGLVAVSAFGRDGVWINIKIFALSTVSLIERPISSELKLSVPAENSELADQLRKFVDYGAPLAMPPGTVSGKVDLPAGLGSTLDNASLQILSIIDDEEEKADLEIAILQPDEYVEIAHTRIRRTEMTCGQSGGSRSVWTDAPELFMIEILRAATGTVEINGRIEYKLGGRRPSEIVDSLQLLAVMHAPNRMGLRMTYGPPEYAVVATTPDHGRDATERWALVADALVRIQQHVSQLLRMPESQSGDETVKILEAADLLSGTPRTGSLTGSFVVYHGPDAEIVKPDGQPVPTIERDPDVVYEFATIKSIEITLDDRVIEVGKQVLFVRGRYEEIGDEESRIQPVSDAVSLHYTGDLEVGRVLARHLPPNATADPRTVVDADSDQASTSDSSD